MFLMEKKKMKNEYVVRKKTTEDTYFYLHPDCGFLAEDCNGGPYRFTNKKTAKDSLKYNNKYRWGYDNTLKDDVLSYDEYIVERKKKLDEMEMYANEHGIEVYRTDSRLFIYLTSVQFGKPIAMWKDITLNTINDLERISKKSRE